MRLTVDRIAVTRVPVELSLEVLGIIFSYLSKPDLKAIRQVCKDFNAAASKFLIDRVYISPQRLNLDVFSAISQHPVFSKYVREIVYDCTKFQQHLTYPHHHEREFRATIGQTHLNLKALTEEDVEEKLQRSLDTYAEHFKQQEDVRKTREDLRLLTDGLRAMPNVSHITITDTWCARGHVMPVTFLDEGTSPSRARAGPIPYFPPRRSGRRSRAVRSYIQAAYRPPTRYTQPCGPLARSWNKLALQPSSWPDTVWQSGPLTDTWSRGYHIAMLAIAESGTSSVTHLSVAEDNTCMCSSRGVPVHRLRAPLNQLDSHRSAFAHLTRIDLAIALDANNLGAHPGVPPMGGFGGGVGGGGGTGLNPSSSSAQAGTIHDCLSAAPHLRSLRLRFCGGTTYGTPDPSFALLLGSSTWPLLSHFAIESIMLRDADLLSFLKRHQSSLRSLSLYGIAFSSGTAHHGPPPPPPPPPMHHGGAGGANGALAHGGPGLCQAFLEDLWHLQLGLESIDRFVISDEDGNSTGNSPGFDGAVVLQYLRGGDPDGTGPFLDRPVGGDEVWDDEYI